VAYKNSEEKKTQQQRRGGRREPEDVRLATENLSFSKRKDEGLSVFQLRFFGGMATSPGVGIFSAQKKKKVTMGKRADHPRK